MIALVFWPFDRWVLPADVQTLYSSFRGALAVFALISLTILAVLPAGPSATRAGAVGIVCFAAIIGYYSGQMEGLLGVQYMYPMPFSILLLASGWPLRGAAAVGVTAVGWLAVAHAAGGLPDIAAGTLSSTIGVAGLAMLFSEAFIRLLRSRFVSELRLAALRETLEERVDEQGRDLRALARARIDSLDSETRWVSRELHDALGQELTAMRVVVELGQMQLESGAIDQGVKTIGELPSLLRKQQVSLRRILARMRPEAVEQLGLREALLGLSREVTHGSGVEAEVNLDVLTDATVALIQPPVADSLYRIVQEALSNVVRHAGASRVCVTLSLEAGALLLRVQDDGRGMTNARDGACHVGLLGIRERATLCGGTSWWGEAPGGRGMAVEVRFPLLQSQPAPATGEQASLTAPMPMPTPVA